MPRFECWGEDGHPVAVNAKDAGAAAAKRVAWMEANDFAHPETPVISVRDAAGTVTRWGVRLDTDGEHRAYPAPAG